MLGLARRNLDLLEPHFARSSTVARSFRPVLSALHRQRFGADLIHILKASRCQSRPEPFIQCCVD